MPDETPPFVARESDIAVLSKHWAGVQKGTPATLRLAAPFGGGRRAVANAFIRSLDPADDTVVWRVNCVDQENGLQWLVRMYGSLVAALSGDVLRRGKIEMLLNAQLPSQPKRVQTWYQQFISGLKESTTDASTGQVQLRIPQDNPLIGLVEIVVAIASRMPVLLELQNPYTVHSLSLAMFVEALQQEAKERGAKLFILLHDEADRTVADATHPMPLLDVYQRSDSAVVHEIKPWEAAEAQKYLDSKGLKSDAARIAAIASGRPGFIAELVEILEADGKLDADLSDVTLTSLLPTEIDESELDAPDGEPAEGERQHATPADAERLMFLAALLGTAFPSNLVADMGGYDRDSVDDMLDAMGGMFEEVQFSKDLGTWIYRFTRGTWREGVIEANDTDQGHDVARRVGQFMERYLVPRGYGFIVKTVRVYGEHGAPNRAGMMRALALSNDNPDVWGLVFDLMRYFDELQWPDALRRTVYMNLLDRMVSAGNTAVAEKIHEEVSAWAEGNEDKDLEAWLLHIGSRIDTRRQDVFRARDRANASLELYKELGNKARMAEVQNHIAQIELQDGNPNAAMQAVNQAIEYGKVDGPEGQVGVIPGIFATAEQIRGQVLRRAGKPAEAAERFKTANEVAGQAGIAPLALESGIGYGEALMASGNVKEARDVLERVLGIARAVGNPARERNAAELLAQAEGALRNYDKALPLAQRVLELTTQLKFDAALPIDLYNLGFFHFVTKKPSEALTFFSQSESRIGGLGAGHPVIKELHYFKGLAHMQVGQLDAAKSSLSQGLKPAQEAKDWRKMCSALENLATIETQMGNQDVAKKHLNDAINFAKQANLREEGKTLRKKLNALA